MARLASGVFLVVQMVILLDFAYAWNESWASRETRGWLAALLGATAACYAGALTLLGLGYRWFHPHGAGDCSLNVFLLTLCLLLGLATSAAALHPAVAHGSLLCSGAIFCYNAYLTVAALSSEPASYACAGRGPGTFLGGQAAGQAGAAGGMVLALAAVAYSAARAGSSGAFLFSGADGSDDGGDGGEGVAAPLLDAEADAGSDGEELADARARATSPQLAPRPLRYNLAAFHAVFALASCYTAMLLTDWGSGAGAEHGQLGVGWASVWIRVSCSWVTAGLYAWSLAAPVVFPERF